MPELNPTPSPPGRFTFSIIPEWILDHEKLSHGAVRLYGILARYSDSSGVSWPSRTTLARRLRCTPITIDRWAAELVEVEALTITRRKGETTKNNLTNLWEIHRVASSVLLSSEAYVDTVASSVLHRTRTKRTKTSEGKNLLDELIEKEIQ